MQLDVLRDLRRINSYQAAVAYPILEEAGQLRSSRLRRSKSDEVVFPRVKGAMKTSTSS
jgi:phosphate:Na+ symporter